MLKKNVKQVSELATEYPFIKRLRNRYRKLRIGQNGCHIRGIYSLLTGNRLRKSYVQETQNCRCKFTWTRQKQVNQYRMGEGETQMISTVQMWSIQDGNRSSMQALWRGEETIPRSGDKHRGLQREEKQHGQILYLLCTSLRTANKSFEM